MITANDPRIGEFLCLWHEAGRAEFEAGRYTNLVYDDYYRKSAHERRKYIALDKGTFDAEGNEVTRSGVYLVDRATGEVYSIKGYGVPNRRVGTLDGMIAAWRRPCSS